MKKYVWIVALLAALAMVMTGCPSGDSGGGDIGWTAVADGSATATSTKITFTFDADVSVSGADITITKVTGEATKGALSGSGKTRDLAISGVKAGTVTVKISKSGIKEGNKTVTLFVAPEESQKWTRSLQPFSFKLDDNYQYDYGYQGLVQKSFLFQGDKINEGDVYTLKITFKASRDFEDKMEVTLVDPSPPSYWTKLSESVTDDALASIKANTEVTVTLTLAATASASANTPAANSVVINTKGTDGTNGQAGSGTRGAITLSFTEFVLTKGAGGTPDVEPASGFPSFTNAASLPEWGIADGDQKPKWEFKSSGGAATIAEFESAKYVVIASIGGGNNDGFGGLQPYVQGDGTNNWSQSAFETKDGWTAFVHAGDDIVYFVFDLSAFAAHTELAGDSTNTQGQFGFNWGGKEFGSVQGYLTSVTLAKPADAADLIDKGSEETVFGYITKTRPSELTVAP